MNATRLPFHLPGFAPQSSVYSNRCGRNTWGAYDPWFSQTQPVGREKTGRVGCRKYDRDKCCGFYYQEWRGQPAWIQLVTDNIIAGCPTFLMRLQLFRDQGVAEVLYHEVGHHLHMTVGSATRGGEEAAESWRK